MLFVGLFVSFERCPLQPSRDTRGISVRNSPVCCDQFPIICFLGGLIFIIIVRSLDPSLLPGLTSSSSSRLYALFPPWFISLLRSRFYLLTRNNCPRSLASPPFIPIYTVRRTAFPFLTGQAMPLLFFLLPSFSFLTMTPPFHVHPLTCKCVCVLGQLLVIVKMVNNLFSFFFHAQFPAYKNVLCIEDGHGLAAPLPPAISNFPIEKNGGYAYPFGISFSLNHSERELHLITRRGDRHK